MGRSSQSRALGALFLASAATAACASDFSTARDVPTRGTLGAELYTALCDRVAAQALPEDVTGASWHAMCYPDDNGLYATAVDTTALVPLDPNALYADGGPAPLAAQQADRAYRVARIEAIARDRVEVTSAFDDALPAITIPLKDLTSQDPTQSCAAAGTGPLHPELAAVLGRMTPVEDDGTLPLFTEALGRVTTNVAAAPDAQAALAHLDARQGYRPLDIILGAARPVLSYPSFVPMVQTLLSLLATDSDPYNPAGILDPSKPLGPGNRRPLPGADAAFMQQLLEVGRDEWRTPAPATLPPLLTVTPDPVIPVRQLLSRPRTTLELTRQIMLQTSTSFEVGLTPETFVTARDPRGYAAVPLVGGAVPAPFVDADHDGLPDVDAAGVFVTSNGQPVPAPFFSPDGVDGPRDGSGRALGAGGAPLYASIDVGQTFMAALEDDLVPLLDPDPAHAHETIMDAEAGAYVLFGKRVPAATRTYPPDPESASPAAPVVLPYDGFDPDTSPLEDLVYALAVMMADPVMDNLTQLGHALLAQHSQAVARLVGLGLQMKAIADAHPEAHLPATSTLWDELLDDLALIVHEQDDIGAGGVLEDLLLSFGNDLTPQLQPAFAAYTNYCDQLTYDPNSTNCSTYTDLQTCVLNGPPWNASSKNLDALHVACDRGAPDDGTNRSALQMFMQTLHDARGMSACTKAGAVANVTFSLGALGTVNFDYPTSSLSGVACTLVGAPAPPSTMPQCGILEIPDVDAMLLDVVLNRATFDIRDPCLLALMKSPITNLVGGVDAFLQEQAGVVGFDTHPTVPGISRFFYFGTPDDGSQGDTNPATKQTWTFIQGLIDPPPTSACKPAPFTDSSGNKLNLFDCTTTPQYDLRHRDPGATFPIELYGFTTNVQPLAAAFDDHGQSALFIDLFNTLHLHWGSAAQPASVCDPTLPKTNDRWCSQDGAVTYEPLLYDVLEHTDLLATLHDTIPILQATSITHCEAQDPQTHACTKTKTIDGVEVLAEALRVMIDPAENKGLTDRNGVQTAPRNDGTTNPQVTPIYLFLDALDEIDAAFTAWASAHPTDDRHPAWLSARSQLVDEFFSVNGWGERDVGEPCGTRRLAAAARRD